MSKQFKIGDHVRWNSEAGYVTGTIIKVHTNDFDTRDIFIMLPKTIRNMKLKVIKQTTLLHTRQKHSEK